MRISPVQLMTVAIILVSGVARAGEADVVDVSVTLTAENTYTFSVTVKHDDTGWEHYADRWQVLGANGAVLGERILLHPHETEQPFTRDLSGVVIPSEIDEVTVRAGDNVHGFGGAEMRVRLPGRGG
jgi:hypothetical protein